MMPKIIMTKIKQRLHIHLMIKFLQVSNQETLKNNFYAYILNLLTKTTKQK